MKREIFIFIATIIFFCRCAGGDVTVEHLSDGNSATDSSIIVIDIDTIKVKNEVKLSSFFSNIQPIILQCDSGGAFGSIDKFYVNDSIFAILDRNVAKSVLIFDKKGNFKYKIGDVGRGRGEYMTPQDFAIDTASNSLYILDSRADIINRYNLSDGFFTKRISIKRRPSVKCYNIFVTDSTIWGDSYFPTAADTNYMLREFSVVTGKQTASYLNKNIYHKGWGEKYLYGFSPFQGKGRYTSYFSEYIFNVRCGSITPYIKIKSDRFVDSVTISKLLGGKNIWLKLSNLRKKQKVYNISNLVEFGSKINFTYFDEERTVNMFFDTITHKADIYRWVTNDMISSPKNRMWIHHQWLCADDKNNKMYGLTAANHIERLLTVKERGQLSDSLKGNTKLDELTLNSNTILWSYDIKPDTLSLDSVI